MSSAQTAIRNRLERIHDKLAALQCPYHFNESVDVTTLADALCTTGGEKPKTDKKQQNLSSNKAATWWPIRDAVFFAEDAVIGCLNAEDRGMLRPYDPCRFSEALVEYAETLGAVKTKSSTLRFPAMVAPAVASSIRRLKVNKGFADFDADAKLLHTRSVLAIVNGVLDCAVEVETVYSCGFEEVNISHQQWERDQKRLLVTAIDPTPPPSSVLGGGTSTDGASAAENEANIRALLEPIFVFRGIPYPESNAAALSDVIRLIHSLPAAANETAGAKQGGETSLARQSAAKDPTLAIKELLASVPSLGGGASKSGGKKGAKGSKEPSKEQQLDDAAKVLRLLYTLDLKSLQDDVNSQIGELQNLTATCKTDPRLGRVGR